MRSVLCRFHPMGRCSLPGSLDYTVKLWDVETKENITTLEHPHGVESVSFSPDGTLLASGLFDHTVELWDIPPYIIRRTDVIGPSVTEAKRPQTGRRRSIQRD